MDLPLMPPAIRPKKRVLIDATPVTNSTDGLSVYIVNLIRHLPAGSLADFEFSVLVNRDVDRPDLEAAMGRLEIPALRVSIAPIGPRRDWDMVRFLRRTSNKFDLIHITSNNYPAGLAGGICTIHDVTFKTWFDRPNRIPGTAWLAQFYLDKVIRRSLRKADAIIAVSQSTKDEIARLFSPPPEQLSKVRVIHEGWEHLAGDSGQECPALIPEETGYIFFIGSHRPHKNITALLEAFRIARRELPKGKMLVVTGTSDRLSDAQRALVDEINDGGEGVIFTGYVSQQQVARLYRNADAFIFPSLSEGFGLPILEAFHFSVPVLASDTTALPEVAGDGALYFDPNDTSSIASALVRFYQDPALADRLRAAGARRLEHFSWTKAATETVELYRQVLGLPPDRAADEADQ